MIVCYTNAGHRITRASNSQVAPVACTDLLVNNDHNPLIYTYDVISEFDEIVTPKIHTAEIIRAILR